MKCALNPARRASTTRLVSSTSTISRCCKRFNRDYLLMQRMFYLLYELQKYIFIRRVRRNRPDQAEPYGADPWTLPGNCRA